MVFITKKSETVSPTMLNKNSKTKTFISFICFLDVYVQRKVDVKRIIVIPFVWGLIFVIKIIKKNTLITVYVIFLQGLVLVVSCCVGSVRFVFCTGHFLMVPLNLTLSALSEWFFLLFNLHYRNFSLQNRLKRRRNVSVVLLVNLNGIACLYRHTPHALCYWTRCTDRYVKLQHIYVHL